MVFVGFSGSEIYAIVVGDDATLYAKCDQFWRKISYGISYIYG